MIDWTSPPKLHDCIEHGIDSEAELLLVEGDSAAKAACLVRSNPFQAVLPMQGSLSMHGKRRAKPFRRTSCMGAGSSVGDRVGGCLPMRLARYSKVVLLFDPDADEFTVAFCCCSFSIDVATLPRKTTFFWCKRHSWNLPPSQTQSSGMPTLKMSKQRSASSLPIGRYRSPKALSWTGQHECRYSEAMLHRSIPRRVSFDRSVFETQKLLFVSLDEFSLAFEAIAPEVMRGPSVIQESRRNRDRRPTHRLHG